jgi:hypothetical protein
MYYIYHIEGVKIGCSTNPERRVKNQGYSKFEILEQHSDIKLAAKREIELRNQYGYKEDNVKTDYVQHYQFGKKGRANMTPGKGAKTQIKNKIGMFAYTKEERLALNTKANIIRARISAEKRRRPVSAFDFKTGKHIADFPSIKDAAIKFNASTGNVGSVINGRRNHTKGYTFKYA